jgi:hypothetical protein
MLCPAGDRTDMMHPESDNSAMIFLDFKSSRHIAMGCHPPLILVKLKRRLGGVARCLVFRYVVDRPVSTPLTDPVRHVLTNSDIPSFHAEITLHFDRDPALLSRLALKLCKKAVWTTGARM